MYTRIPATRMILIVSMLLFAPSINAISGSPPMFPVEVFGSQDIKVDLRRHEQAQQALVRTSGSKLDIDYDKLRYSNSSFRGDETGDSPFFYCPESDPDNDLYAIDKIVLNPNPPRINYVFVFHAHGYWREEIFESKAPFRVTATVRREDREGLDFSFERDFCDFVDMMEMDGRSTRCPPGQGNGTIHKFEFVDFGISEGNYSLKIDVKGNNKRVFCVQSWFDLTRKMLD